MCVCVFGGEGGSHKQDKTEFPVSPSYTFTFLARDCLRAKPFTPAAMMTVLEMISVFLCVAFASAEVMPMTDFDLEKMEGKWFLVGFASNAKWFASHKMSMKTGVAMMVPTASGDLDMSYSNLKSDGSCWSMTHLAKKTETPGRFVYHSQRYKSNNDMCVVEAKFDKYAITHTLKTKGGVSEVLTKLYSRSADISEDFKLKFRQFSLDSGIMETNIAILPPNGECSVA